MSTAYLTEAAQDEAEITAFCELVAGEGVKSYLEVGSKFGGSLWRVANAMPPGSRVVAVDLPGGTKAWKESEASLNACIAALQAKGYDAHVIWGNSTDAKVIEQVRALGPFDLVMLDGDHRLQGVTLDWDNYSPMGRMIAFHDIAWHRAPTWEGVRIDVPELWGNLRRRHRSREICFDPSGKNNGLGVLWRS